MEGMIEIMRILHGYVPTKRCDRTYIYEGREITIPKAIVHAILLGGDQLTAARARGAKKAKVNSVDPELRFEGLIPVAEDWHTRLNLLCVRA